MTQGRRLGFALLLAACGQEHTPPTAVHERLPEGVVARVGGEEIRVESVARIARAQRKNLADARELAISDALFAVYARSDPARGAAVSSAERGALGRALGETLRAQALALGPASDDELAKLTAERWVELDRPESVRVVHAVVRVEKPADDPRARAFAERLAAALRGAPNGDEFVRRAQAFPAEGYDIKAERLPPCTLDGRTWEPGARPPAALTGIFDLTFTRAAHSLKAPGDQTDLVKTPFGYHVIRLEQRLPEQRESPEKRREMLADVVLASRAKPEYEALVARLRAETPITVERAADELTALVPVGVVPSAP